MLSDEWLPRYRLLENFTAKWNGNGNGNGNRNGNGNAYDRGDYNSSFALRAVELKIDGKQHPHPSFIWSSVKYRRTPCNSSSFSMKSSIEVGTHQKGLVKEKA